MPLTSSCIEMQDTREDTRQHVPNPMLIPLVLEKVFEYVDMNNLANCRRVCRDWKLEARNIMRQRCCIKFTCLDQIKSYIEDMKDITAEESVHEVYQFGALASARSRGFVSGIRRVRMSEMMDNMSPYYTAGYKELCQDVLRTFFATFGSRTKVLELDSDFEMALPELRRLLSQETGNLESLSMTIRYTRSHRLFNDEVPFFKPKLTTLRSDVGMVPVSLLRDFFTMAPNLRKVTCLPLFCSKKWKYSPRQPRAGRVDFIRVLFHTIVMGPNPPVLQYLSNLDINLQLTEGELQGLIAKAFPLNSIKLGICSDVKGTTLATLLNAGRNLLIRVSLNFHPNSHAASYTRYNIHLLELRYLCLCGFKAPVTFIRNCPVLKTLIVGQSGNLSRTFPVNEIGPHYLQDLFVQWDELEDPAIIERITRCFPKLKSFSMRKGNDNVLREIYLSMPFLQNLTILGGGFTDEGITGVTEMVYKDISESGSLSLADPGKLRTNMSIGSLSRLRKLHLESELITDVSVFLGIGSCLNLQHLHLQCNQLTDYCLWRLTKFPYLSCLNVVSCAGLTVENKIKMKNDFKAQGRQVNIEWTIEEVYRESQRRALILPDVPHDYYQQALLGIGGNVEDGANGVPPGPGPRRPQLDSSDSEDDDIDEYRYRPRGRLNWARYERDFERNLGERGDIAMVRQRNRMIAAIRHMPRGGIPFRPNLYGDAVGGQPEELIFRAPLEAMLPRPPEALEQPNGPQPPRQENAEAGIMEMPNPVYIDQRQQIRAAALPLPLWPPNVNRIQIGPPSPSDFPPQIPIDLDFLDGVEM